MKTTLIKPELDGVSHINVYSKGVTTLGRFLTNFALAPAPTPDGKFNSIEGYWYWLSCKNDALRTLHGWEAKKVGRAVGGHDWVDSNEFQEKIKAAIKLKLEAYPSQFLELKNCKLPLTHYYVYGSKIVDVPQAKWILDFLESLKNV